MLLGERLRTIRESKHVSITDLEKRTGVRRSYWSRFEGGYRMPTIITLEKWAAALRVPLYELFFEEEMRPDLPKLARPEGMHAIDRETWLELSRLSERIIDSFGLIGPILQLAKDKCEVEQLRHLGAIKEIFHEGHLALTQFANLWSRLDEQIFEEEQQSSPKNFDPVPQAALQNPIPERRLRWSEYKSRKLQQQRV
jgi:transcriptional regulator with XRE-family HTH domain